MEPCPILRSNRATLWQNDHARGSITPAAIVATNESVKESFTVFCVTSR
jgi:hypothetical protein